MLLETNNDIGNLRTEERRIYNDKEWQKGK